MKNLSLEQDAFVDFGNSAFDKTLSPVRTLGAVVSFRFVFVLNRRMRRRLRDRRFGRTPRFRFSVRRSVDALKGLASKSPDVSTAKAPTEPARLTFLEPVFPAFFRKRLELENAGSKNVG